jgi:DNA-binding transcriptional LysR family regulator
MDNQSGEMRVFVGVVESGSFSAAATVLKLTPSAVSKLVGRIENRLGVLLFRRSTRQLVLTREGEQFYESCVRILEDIAEAEHSISQVTVAPRGLLRVDVSLPLGTHYVVPLIPEFSTRYPGITLDLSLSDALIDLQRDRIDVAIRMGPLADAGFHARKLGLSRRAVVAAPGYLEARGVPKVIDDLAKHRCLNFNFRRSMDEWPFIVDGRAVRQPIKGAMLTNNGETMRQMTLDGLGISRLGLFHIIHDLEAGRLVELLPEYNPGDTEEIHAIFSSQRHMPARVRVFLDFLVEKLEPALRCQWPA